MALSPRLSSLEKQHRILENALQNLKKHPFPDYIEVSALKVQKLAIKDEIASLNRATA